MVPATPWSCQTAATAAQPHWHLFTLKLQFCAAASSWRPRGRLTRCQGSYVPVPRRLRCGAAAAEWLHGAGTARQRVLPRLLPPPGALLPTGFTGGHVCPRWVPVPALLVSACQYVWRAPFAQAYAPSTPPRSTSARVYAARWTDPTNRTTDDVCDHSHRLDGGAPSSALSTAPAASTRARVAVKAYRASSCAAQGLPATKQS